MQYNNFDGGRYYSDSNHKGNRNIIIVAIVALLAGLIGSVVMAFIAPHFIYGKLIPWPEHLSINGGEYQLPSQPPSNPQQISVDLTELGNKISEVANTSGAAVVGITNKGYVQDWFGNTSLVEKSSGTGFIIDSNGLIVTNEHVISGAKEVIVTLASGTKVDATVVGADEWSDLAVIKIDINDLNDEERDLPFVTFGDSSSLRVGHFVVAIGNPLGLEFARTTTHGIVSAVDRILTVDEKQYSLIQIDAAINEGNSGGPLLDLNGNVIGINTIKIKNLGIEGLGFAIPSNQAKPIIEQLISHGKVTRPYLGIKGQPLSATYNPTLKGKVDNGILVVEVNPDSPVDKAGMETGDVITAIDGDTIETFTELQSILYNHKTGEVITVEVFRASENRTLELQVTLGSTS